MADSTTAEQVVRNAASLLHHLRAAPYPVLETPEGVKRRASVAVILRVNPSSQHWPPSGPGSDHDLSSFYDLESFFSQDWVKHGDLELLFIKRASRKGDRWTSHIALPGGRRDPEDEDDKAAAVRETWEEVGIDLKSYALDCGNLPQRLVTTHWGKKPLLVLCPYVFILTHHQIPPLKLQPTEVASTHWVPIRSLMSPAQRTVAFEDVSSRVANQETGVKKWMLSIILGRMMFAAINLVPTESLYSVESPGQEIELQDNRHAQLTRQDRIQLFLQQLWRSDIFNQFPPPRKEGPLLLWGLTLGVVSDLLDLLPPHNALTLWTYPTFTPLDVRLSIFVLTYRFKHRKRAELQAGTEFSRLRPSFGAATDSVAHTITPTTAEASDVSSSTVLVERPDETGFHGLGTGSGIGPIKSKKPAVTTMLEGYYDIVRRAVALALLGRFTLATVFAILAWKRYGAQVKSQLKTLLG